VGKRISERGLPTGEYRVEIRGNLLNKVLDEILGEHTSISFDGTVTMVSLEPSYLVNSELLLKGNVQGNGTT
jgi:hypothetical protein